MAGRPASGVRDFLKTILLLELWVGLWVTLKNQFRPHITVEYPKETVELSPRFRGVPRLRFGLLARRQRQPVSRIAAQQLVRLIAPGRRAGQKGPVHQRRQEEERGARHCAGGLPPLSGDGPSPILGRNFFSIEDGLLVQRNDAWLATRSDPRGVTPGFDSPAVHSSDN